MDGKATMKDIAQKIGISVNAVSLALNNRTGVSEEVRMQVLRVADEMGYLGRKDKFINTFKRTNLCVMMQKMYHTDMYFYSKVLYAITDEARSSSYDSVIHFFDDNEFVLPNCITERRVAGIVVVGKISDENLTHLLEFNVPIVLVDHASLLHPVTCIVSDSKAGGYMATKYLLDNRFTDIGFFGDLSYSLSIQERHFGFRQAIETTAPHLAQQSVEFSITERGVEDLVLGSKIEQLAARVKALPKIPQAFVCSNDFAAIALSNAVRSMDLRVPEDLSLIGFDNIDLCKMTVPNLTTVNVGMGAMGRKAVEQLLRLIAKPGATIENIVMHVDLVERDSVALPKRGQESKLIG